MSFHMNLYVCVVWVHVYVWRCVRKHILSPHIMSSMYNCIMCMFIAFNFLTLCLGGGSVACCWHLT